jgi:hypothetical protein
MGMNRIVALAVVGVVLCLAGCTGMPGSEASSVASPYHSVSTPTGVANGYNWLEGGD